MWKRRTGVEVSRGIEAEEGRILSWPTFPPEHYLGQLESEFQERLQNERACLGRADCRFYHCMELPNGDVVTGPWDLRGREAGYLGDVEFDGARVLELGPASGPSYRTQKCGGDTVNQK